MEEWTVETSDYKYAHCTVWKGRKGDIEAKIELWEYSEDNHEVVIKINPESNEMSSLLNLRHPPPEMAEETVQVVPLDSLFTSLMKPIAEPRILLKIDTEGYDLQVFRGATRALPHILALQAELFVEPVFDHAPHYLEALAEFEQAGFELDHLSLVSRTERGDLMTMNALMKRAG